MADNNAGGYIELDKGKSPGLRSAAADHSNIVPTDHCQCVYMGLLLAGVGFLLPYNSFIIAVDYFQSKYPGTTIVFDMSLIYILVALLAVIINNLLVETLSLQTRITFGYVVAFGTLLFVAVCEIWLEAFDLETGYYVNLLAVAVVSFGCTVQQSSFYGYTSMLPSRYTQAVMTGESAAGLLVSASRIATKLLVRDERLNTLVFFCVSVGCVGGCAGVQAHLRTSPLVRFYIDRCSRGQEEEVTLEPTEDVGLVDMLDGVEPRCGRYGVLSLRSPPPSPLEETEDAPPFSSSSAAPHYRVQDVVVRMRTRHYTRNIRWWAALKRGCGVRWVVCRQVWGQALSILLAYLVTLSLFPGIESEVVSCTLGSWMPVLLMAAFNAADCAGKVCACVGHAWWSPSRLLSLSLGRVLLVPLLAACAGPRPLLLGETWPLLLSLALGLTNGMAGSLPMITAPLSVEDQHKEITGNIMTLFYSVGLTTGSGVAYLIDYALGPPLLNPCAAEAFDNSTLPYPDVWNITLPLNDTFWNATAF